MQWRSFGFLVGTSILLTGCGRSLRSQPANLPAWTNAYYFWSGSGTVNSSPSPVDAIYFQAGFLFRDTGVHHSWSMLTPLPAELPPVRQYWAVVRFGPAVIPDVTAQRVLKERIDQTWRIASANGWNLVGLQLDVDCPTASLPEYAAFLHQVRGMVPQNAKLSITALLDWFHDAGVTPVIREVDEFVPQFYDTKPLRGDNPTVGAKIDADRWAPAFNRFGKPYRVGISTFGRVRRLHFTTESPKGEVLAVYTDQTPADFAGKPGLNLQVSHNDAGELVLSYRVVGQFMNASRVVAVGDVFQFIVPQPSSVRAAFEAAKKMERLLRWRGLLQVAFAV